MSKMEVVEKPSVSDGKLKEKKSVLDRCRDILSNIKAVETSGASENSPKDLSLFSSNLPSLLTDEITTSKEKKDTKKLKIVQRLVKEYLDKAFQLLEEPGILPEDILISLLRGLSTNIGLFKEFPVIRKKIVKLIISIWSSHSSDSVRVCCLLTLHSLCSKYSTLLETAIKMMYVQYGKACRSLSTHNLGQATLLLNGLVEIFCINMGKSVEQGTSFLRQMANLVQHASKHPGKDTIKKVMCWQFIALTRFWAQLFARQLKGKDLASESSSPLMQLFWPFCNILNGLFNFQVAPRYFAFHFHLVAAALEMITEIGCHIPVASCLLKIVSHVAKQPLYKLEAKKAAYDLVAIYKVSKSEIITKGYLECIGDEALFYLLKSLTAQINNATFPEQAGPVIEALREIIQSTKQIDRTFKKQVEGHISKLVQQKKEIEALRISEALTPASVAGGKVFVVPAKSQVLVGYVASLEKVRNMKRKLLADKDEEMEEEQAEKKAKRKAKIAKRESDDIPEPVKPSLKSTKKTSTTTKTTSSTTPARPTKKAKKSSSKGADEEDIIEDFILDD